MGCERVTAWGMSSGAGMGTSVLLGLAEPAQLVCPCTSPRVPVGGDGAGGGPSPWEGAARGALRPQQPPRGFLVRERSLAGGAGRTGWVGQGPGGCCGLGGDRWDRAGGSQRGGGHRWAEPGGVPRVPVPRRQSRAHDKAQSMGTRCPWTVRVSSPRSHLVPG